MAGRVASNPQGVSLHDEATGEGFGAAYPLPVAVGSSALPTGAATAAKQDTIIGHLDGVETLLTAIDGGTPAALGQAAMAASMPVVLASDQSAIPIVGPTAHGQGVSTNPVLTGFIGRNVNQNPAGDFATVWGVATLSGVQVVRPYSVPETEWKYAAAASGIVNTTTAVTIAAAGGAGLKHYITSIDVMAEALNTATELAIRDGAGGAVLWRTKIGTGGQPLTSIVFPTPIAGTAATLLEVVTLTASVTGAVYFNARGFTAS